jgi:DNA-directed RNA polymerase specialized sigma24 family protein
VGRTNPNSSEIEVLYHQYGAAALLLFASAMAGDRGRAQDALHQVFLKLIENRGLSRAADKKAYLFACVRNAVLNETASIRIVTGAVKNCTSHPATASPLNSATDALAESLLFPSIN